jgi:hypothetical protein
MTYVPVTVWVPDTAEGGAVTSEIKLKACETCYSLVPQEFMDTHVTVLHPPPPEAVPHA